MSLHLAAQHLSSKGRHGDDTLVHVSKGELAGLQALAQSHGKTLTVNPQTGLPEAFGLKQLLPMAAGAALVASGVGAPMAAAMVGGGMWAATGSLQQGLMAGLGAYGGAGLAGGLSAMGAEAGTQAAAGEAAAAGESAAQAEAAKQAALEQAGREAVTPQAIEKVAADQAARNAVGNQAVWEQSARDYASNAAGNTYELAGGYRPTFGPADAYAPGAGPAVTSNAVVPSGTEFTPATQQTLAQSPMRAGLSAAVDNPSAYVNKLGGGMEAAKYGLAAAAPVIADEMAPKPYQAPVIKHDTDMGQRYAYSSGYDNSIPGRTGAPAYTKISNEEAKKLYGFAEGGDVQQDPNAQQVPAFDPVVRMASGGSAGGSYVPSYSDVSYGMGPSAGLGSTPQGIASLGAPAAVNYDAATGYTPNELAAMNYVSAPQGNPNANIVALYAKVEADRKAAEAAAAAKNGSWYTLAPDSMQGSPIMRTSFSWANDMGAPVYDVVGVKADGTPVYGTFNADANGVYGPGSAQYNNYMKSQPTFGMAAGGITSLGSYSDGGRLLKGPGDGMSDNIPAQIGGKQPARLADGEFVVPADVVSHLGNGSTDAGAKQLYKMMDKIRQARTGRKAQGKQINPNKFIPT